MLPQDELEQSEEVIQGEKPRTLDRSQKLMAGFLAFFAVFILVLWSIQFRNTISGVNDQTGDETASETTTEENMDEILKTKDTDGDGITDYDEMNVYKTSAYMEDSDSDGFNDKNEIDSENDPNCPVGRDCYGSAVYNESANIDSSQSNSSLNSLLEQTGYNPAMATSSQTGGQSGLAGIADILGKDVDAATLRQYLIQYGMKKDILDQVSDEDLLKSYQEVLDQ